MVQDLASLLWVVNLGCIDLNQWYARCDDTDRPDYLHFDLDPGPGRRFARVRETALVRARRARRARHAAAGEDHRLERHARLRADRPRARCRRTVWRFAKAWLARASWQAIPKLITAEYRIANRPRGRVLVDYNQNAWGARSPRSTRCGPTPQATVSTPVTWQEVERGVRDRGFPARQRPGARAPAGRPLEAPARRARTVPPGGTAVSLPLKLSYAPMEAEIASRASGRRRVAVRAQVGRVPRLAFRDGDVGPAAEQGGQAAGPLLPRRGRVARSRSGAARFVLDGEIVIPVAGRLSFDELLLRVHPAASRVRTLVAAHRARLVVFDLLVDERGRSLVELPLEQRRRRLEAFAEKFLGDDDSVVLSRATRQVRTARGWLADGSGGDLDGVMAKRLDLPYRSGERDGMVKVKRRRTADCVVGGFRYGSRGSGIGSLLLGLYDDDGLLHHVGFCSALDEDARRGLRERLERLRAPPGFTGRAPGGPSRWSTERSAQWEPLRPKLVVEVGYDHVSNGRFRHGTRFLRWRPDKAPRQCTLEQIA